MVNGVGSVDRMAYGVRGTIRDMDRDLCDVRRYSVLLILVFALAGHLDDRMQSAHRIVLESNVR